MNNPRETCIYVAALRRAKLHAMTRLSAVAFIALAAACATPPLAPAPASPDAPVCRFEGGAVFADFDAAGIASCDSPAPGRLDIFVRPENSPINPSPWYAFRIQSERARPLAITLVYAEGRHRYAPDIKSSEGPWRRLAEDAVAVSRDGARATIALEAPKGALLVAAQPVLDGAANDAWIARMVASGVFSAAEIGRSREGRALRALEAGADRPEQLAIIGRQHPPETTGAQALAFFVERLAADEPLARRFRDRFGLLVVPLLNPDGVARGHWRHNAGGVDLNRDWGPFGEPETQAGRAAIARRAGGEGPGRLALILDFHATRRDILYTQGDAAAGARAWFAGAWLAAINARLEGAPLARDPDHLPGRPTLKTWGHEAYGVPAITFELGDETPRARIRALAKIAAEEMMTLLLEGPPSGAKE